MNKKIYCGLLREYQKLVGQKQFNEYLCDRSRLDEVRKTLLLETHKFEGRILEKITRARRHGVSAQYLSYLDEKYKRIAVLREKIFAESRIVDADYESTFCEQEIIAGFTLPEFLIAVLIGGVVGLIYWLFNR